METMLLERLRDQYISIYTWKSHRPEFHCFSRHVRTVLNFVGAGIKCNEYGKPATSFIAFHQQIHVLMFHFAR